MLIDNPDSLPLVKTTWLLARIHHRKSLSRNDRSFIRCIKEITPDVEPGVIRCLALQILGQRCYVGGLQTLGAIFYGELHLLAFLEIAVTF